MTGERRIEGAAPEKTRAVAARAALALLCLALGACATAPVTRPAVSSPPLGREPAVSDTKPGPDGADEGSNEAAPASPGSARVTASDALIEQSRAQRAAGSYAQAAASIERALRIAPNDAALWIELGEIKLASGDTEQARVLARKAMTLAGTDDALRARAERLVATAAR